MKNFNKLQTEVFQTAVMRINLQVLIRTDQLGPSESILQLEDDSFSISVYIRADKPAISPLHKQREHCLCTCGEKCTSTVFVHINCSLRLSHSCSFISSSCIKLTAWQVSDIIIMKIMKRFVWLYLMCRHVFQNEGVICRYALRTGFGLCWRLFYRRCFFKAAYIKCSNPCRNAYFL